MLKSKELQKFLYLYIAMGLALFFFFSSCTSNVPEASLPAIESISPDITTTINKAVTLSINVSNSDSGTLSYQWFTAEDKLNNGTFIEGQIEPDLTIAHIEVGTFYYYCVVTNTLGTSTASVISPRISVTVSENISAKAPVIVELGQPQNVSGEIGDDFSLKVFASSQDSGTLTYQWYYSKTKDGESNSIDGATASSYTGKISTDLLGFYYCIITNTITDNGDGGTKTATVTTNKAILSNNVINANIPQITLQPLDVTAIIPATSSFAVGAICSDGGTLSYQWYSIAEGENQDSAILISDANNSTYEVSTNSVGKKGFFCIITNTLEDNGDGGTKTAVISSETAWLESVVLDQVIEQPVFTIQPQSMCLKKNEPYTFSCKAEVENYNTVYKWFSTDEKGESKTAITNGWSSSSRLEVEGFSEKGIRYYVCAASSFIPEGDEVPSNVTYSNITAIAYTGLPIVQIDTVNKEEPAAEYVNPPAGAYGAGLKNATKVPGRMQIFKDGQDNAIYDSGEYEKKKNGLTIKLRGNTSAYGPKKPYKIKLQKKADLLSELLGRNDAKYKDKEWILLKDATSLDTFVGMTVADLAGTPWTPEFAFVNVVMNGDYKGIYLLIEAISINEKRIDVADDGYIIERDAYWWNEDVKFITNFNQKYTFKYPDEDDITDSQIDFIKNYMNTTEEHISDGTYEDYIDTESFARWILIQDMLGIGDGAGSNMFLSKYDSSNENSPYSDGTWSKLTTSTPWDFDSVYANRDTWGTWHTRTWEPDWGTLLYPLLFTSSNSAFKNSYKSQWENIKSTLWSDLLEKITELQEAQGEDINLSRECDAKRWNSSASTIEQNRVTAENWFTARVNWLNTAINGL